MSHVDFEENTHGSCGSCYASYRKHRFVSPQNIADKCICFLSKHKICAINLLIISGLVFDYMGDMNFGPKFSKIFRNPNASFFEKRTYTYGTFMTAN